MDVPGTTLDGNVRAVGRYIRIPHGPNISAQNGPCYVLLLLIPLLILPPLYSYYYGAPSYLVPDSK